MSGIISNTRVELDLGILRENIRRTKAALDPKSSLIFVVKANAYGHGMADVANCAFEEGVREFAVCHLQEAILLRQALPDAGIIVMGVLRGGDVRECMDLNAAAAIVDYGHARELSEATAGCRLRCHVKIDTGMGRLGLAWTSAAGVIGQIAKLPGLDMEGIFSHFSSADMPGSGAIMEQADHFARVLKECAAHGLSFRRRHISNSGGFQFVPACDYDAVRLGILLYGYPPRGPGARVDTMPVLQWKTSVLQVKNMPAGHAVGYGATYRTASATRIAVLDAGYADGYPRQLGNRADIIVGGRRARIIGRVSMNLIAADIGLDAPVNPGDEAVLIGRQGMESVWADELASLCSTIPYEILTGIKSR